MPTNEIIVSFGIPFIDARVERGTGRGRSGKDPRRNHGSNGRKGHYRPKEAKRERAHHERMNGKQRDGKGLLKSYIVKWVDSYRQKTFMVTFSTNGTILKVHT